MEPTHKIIHQPIHQPVHHHHQNLECCNHLDSLDSLIYDFTNRSKGTKNFNKLGTQ